MTEQYNIPLCFSCKERPSVNQGFCNECLEASVKRKIEIREDCKVCGTKIINARYRTFCSKKCRIKYHNQKRKVYQREWKRAKRRGLDSYVGIEVK